LLLDYLLQFAALMLLTFILYLVGKSAADNGRATLTNAHHFDQATVEKWVEAIFILVPFLLHWGYFTLFEALWNGQTPGKRVAKIRVIKDTGRPIGLFESMGRNLVRIVDMLPGIYAVGVITMFLNRRQQRLGDLVAGTIVVHERVAEAPMHGTSGNRTFTAGAFEPATPQARTRASTLPGTAVARLSGDDLRVMEGFFARRLDMPMDTRALLAQRLVRSIALKMQIDPLPEMSEETFLEEVAYAMREQGRLH
ncbi:MAG TPA: RDD family protein, partial [Acidisarcina sp.]